MCRETLEWRSEGTSIGRMDYLKHLGPQINKGNATHGCVGGRWANILKGFSGQKSGSVTNATGIFVSTKSKQTSTKREGNNLLPAAGKDRRPPPKQCPALKCRTLPREPRHTHTLTSEVGTSPNTPLRRERLSVFS